MGSMTHAPIRGLNPEPRPVLVTVLSGLWLLLAAGGVAAAILRFAHVGETPQKILPVVLLVLAALAGFGAIGLLRKKSRARPLLATVGVLVLVLSGFDAWRLVTSASSEAASLAATEPDAANAVAPFRAGSAVIFLLQSIPLVVALGLLRHPGVSRWLGLPESRPRTGARVDPLLAAAALAVLAGAASFLFSKTRAPGGRPEAGSAEAPPGGPAEMFSWSGQPIAFSPPGAGWTRERHAEGGRKGVSFTRYEAPPSRIIVAEASLDSPARSVDEILPRFRLTSGSFPSADSATVGEPARAVIGGESAFRTDYMIRERSMQHQGRELLTVAGGHAFVLTFLGRGTDVPVFEGLVDSVRFPQPGAGEGVRTTTEASVATDAGTTPLTVGGHRVAVRIPPGWEHVDYGERQEFRNGETRIGLADGGEAPLGATELDDERLVARALRLYRHDPRRWEIGAKTRFSAPGGEALAVETRDPLSHLPAARVVLFLHAGRLLVLGPVLGTFEATRAPIEALARSVRFLD